MIRFFPALLLLLSLKLWFGHAQGQAVLPEGKYQFQGKFGLSWWHSGGQWRRDPTYNLDCFEGRDMTVWLFEKFGPVDASDLHPAVVISYHNSGVCLTNSGFPVAGWKWITEDFLGLAVPPESSNLNFDDLTTAGYNGPIHWTGSISTTIFDPDTFTYTDQNYPVDQTILTHISLTATSQYCNNPLVTPNVPCLQEFLGSRTALQADPGNVGTPCQETASAIINSESTINAGPYHVTPFWTIDPSKDTVYSWIGTAPHGILYYGAANLPLAVQYQQGDQWTEQTSTGSQKYTVFTGVIFNKSPEELTNVYLITDYPYPLDRIWHLEEIPPIVNLKLESRTFDIPAVYPTIIPGGNHTFQYIVQGDRPLSDVVIGYRGDCVPPPTFTTTTCGITIQQTRRSQWSSSGQRLSLWDVTLINNRPQTDSVLLGSPSQAGTSLNQLWGVNTQVTGDNVVLQPPLGSNVLGQGASYTFGYIKNGLTALPLVLLAPTCD